MSHHNKIILIVSLALLIATSCQSPQTETTQRKYEVYGTSNDYRAPWLALRNAPDSDSLLLQKLTDGTQVIILDTDSNSTWVKVQMVVSEGYVNKNWLRKIPTEAEKKRANFGDFTTALANFHEILQNKDVEKMQDFINPETGILVIRPFDYSEIPYHYDSIYKMEDYGYSLVFREGWNCEIKNGSRPKLKVYRDETARWNKTGCYWDKKTTDAFSKAEKTSRQRGSGGIVPMDKIQQIEEKISCELYSTAAKQIFFFGTDGYFWYLYGIDLTYVVTGDIDIRILN